MEKHLTTLNQIERDIYAEAIALGNSVSKHGGKLYELLRTHYKTFGNNSSLRQLLMNLTTMTNQIPDLPLLPLQISVLRSNVKEDDIDKTRALRVVKDDKGIPTEIWQ